MESQWIDSIPWVYISIQGVITLIVSIMGVKYVRNEFLLQQNRVKKQQELQINIQQQQRGENVQSETATNKPEQQEVNIDQNDTDRQETAIQPTTDTDKDTKPKLTHSARSEEYKVCYSLFILYHKIYTLYY